MKKSSKFLAIALALVLVFSIVGLVACNDDKENYPEPSGYEVDWSNNFGTVTFYNGDSLIGQGKLSEHLDMAQQETLVVEDETYVFYSFVQLLYNLSFAEFEKIDLIDSNDVETIFPFSYEQFISLIAIVGVVEDGEFVQFNKMAVGVKSQQMKKSDLFDPINAPNTWHLTKMFGIVCYHRQVKLACRDTDKNVEITDDDSLTGKRMTNLCIVTNPVAKR